jgi:hypothetical protein
MAVPSKRPTSDVRRAYPSDHTRTARRRAQKAERRGANRQHYINLAQRLQFIADELTTAEDADIRADLLKFVNRIRLQGTPPKKKDYERVLEAICLHECHTVYDLHEHTHLTKDAIWKILDGLLATRRIEERSGDEFSDEGRDEYSTLFFAAGTPSFHSLAVLP